jgi:hypothetical protein
MLPQIIGEIKSTGCAIFSSHHLKKVNPCTYKVSFKFLVLLKKGRKDGLSRHYLLLLRLTLIRVLVLLEGSFCGYLRI